MPINGKTSVISFSLTLQTWQSNTTYYSLRQLQTRLKSKYSLITKMANDRKYIYVEDNRRQRGILRQDEVN